VVGGDRVAPEGLIGRDCLTVRSVCALVALNDMGLLALGTLPASAALPGQAFAMTVGQRTRVARV
jgi:hypothetical protein